MPEQHRSAWVLAGGRSSRMGRDKALIEVHGGPLAARVADELLKVCGSATIVGDPAKYGAMGFPVVADSYPGQGPLAGIEAALGATETDLNLIAACDLPALDAGTLEGLFELGGDIAVPRHESGKLEPLCAVWARRCHGPVRELLESGVRSVNEALRLLRDRGFALRYLQVRNAETFANLNTPEELNRYRG